MSVDPPSSDQVPSDQSLVAAARAWLAVDPDPETRAEIESLLERQDMPALRDRFGSSLQFGTAGLRGALGGGPNRMNRLVVRRAAAGLARHLGAIDPGCAGRGVVIGHDARRGSADFALDTACVLAAHGIRALLLPPHVPTPVLAWSVVEMDAAAGVMVTASHNPPQDNGYKVYLGDGAQIVPPHDHLIAQQIEMGDLDVALAPSDHSLIERLGDALVDRYAAFAAGVRLSPGVPGVPVTATALHGVGGALLVEVLGRSGLGAPEVVALQQQPDPAFPTVAFPNPEEPGAMDAVIELARERGAVLALANDPDADRLGAAIPLASGAWRRLSGDEIGWLLADHILSRTTGDDRLVVTTLVSSSLLQRMATAHGVRHLETYTGFKWIGHAVLEHPDLRFVFGYEQALGYLVAQRPLDKDGISAAVMLVEAAACALADGETVEQRLASIRARYGDLRTAERSIRMAPADAAARVAVLAADPPGQIGNSRVTGVEHYAEAGLLRLWCGAVRLQVRPSGTEPKVKLYVEVEGDDPTAWLDPLGELVLGTA
mgnify:CR=1 FL=1